MKRFLLWLKPSFEGDDNKSSFRRISAFIILLVMIYVGVAGTVTSMLHLYVLAIYATAFLMLVGIITIDNILTLINTYKNK